MSELPSVNELSGLIVEVYRCGGEDCSLNGVTAKNDFVLLILPQGGPFKAKDFIKKMPIVEIDKREDMSRRHGDEKFIVAVEYGTSKSTDFGLCWDLEDYQIDRLTSLCDSLNKKGG